jgi:hypothetical protein
MEARHRLRTKSLLGGDSSIQIKKQSATPAARADQHRGLVDPVTHTVRGELLWMRLTSSVSVSSLRYASVSTALGAMNAILIFGIWVSRC